MPLSCHLKRLPNEYWVNEYRVSPSWRLVFEWVMTADGRWIVDPAGKSIIIPSSQSTVCPLIMALKDPSTVTEHQPYGRLAKSLCLKQTVCGPRLKQQQQKHYLPSFCVGLGCLHKRHQCSWNSMSGDEEPRWKKYLFHVSVVRKDWQSTHWIESPQGVQMLGVSWALQGHWCFSYLV